MARTTAKPTRRSLATLSLLRPSVNSTAASAASTIWAMKTRSRSGSIGDLGGVDDALTEEMAEAGRRVQIDLAPEELTEFALQIDELKEADARVGGELDEHVDVALGAEVVAQHGSEEGEATDAAAAAEARQALLVDLNLQTHGAPPLP